MRKIKIIFFIIFLGLILFFIPSVKSEESSTNIEIQGNNKYAWSQGIGWINFAPAKHGGVLVADNELKGYAWSPAIGWINMNPEQAGVKNDGQGNLSGFAWSQSAGWINFAPAGEEVKINLQTGVFSGWAWGENIGWISFNCENTYSCVDVDYKVKTVWRPSEVKSDKIAPKTKIVPKKGKYKFTQTITMFASDNAGGSGMEGIYYAFGDSSNFIRYSKPLKITKDTIINFYSQDRTGNKEKVRKAKYSIQKARFVSKNKKGNEMEIKKGALYYANDFSFLFSIFPNKLQKERYYLEAERIKKYAPNLSNAKNNSLKKYWQINTNLNKYSIGGGNNVFKIKLVFSYNQKEFNMLKGRQKSLKEENLKLKYYNPKTKEWKDILAKFNKDKNTFNFTVNILSPKFFYPQMWFAITR